MSRDDGSPWKDQPAYLDVGYSRGGDIGGVGIGVEHRIGNGRSAYVDLVADQEVGGMRGLGTLVFWALLSLSAVVVNSYGQTPTATQTASATLTATATVAPTLGPVPLNQGKPGMPVPGIVRNPPPIFPAQAQGTAVGPAPVVKSTGVPTVLPKGYVPPAGPTSIPH